MAPRGGHTSDRLWLRKQPRGGWLLSGRTTVAWIGVMLAVLSAGCAGRVTAPTAARPAPAHPPSAAGALEPVADEPPAAWPAKTYYRTVEVMGHTIFYREAGRRERGTILLLHGFPSSSHTYRELIPLLSGRYHVVAPDYLGSGFSDHPSTRDVHHTFDLLASFVTGFVDALKLDRYVLYMQDFGGPVGFRVAIQHPERLRGLVVQNANAYLEGLTPARQAFFRNARDARTPDELRELMTFVSDDAIRERQYLRDVPGELSVRMSPDAWTHDLARLATPDDRVAQVRLFQDYQNNIDAYPKWQAFLREHQPPTLIVWGKRDPAFIAAGAAAYLRDLPQAKLALLDAGHFAVEEQPVPIAQHIVQFMMSLPSAAK
jgi:pimeloyl-ACP methyl ester carboxylesterase